MRIAVVSDRERAGGAAIAASYLCRGLREAGAEVRRFVWTKDSHDPGTTQVGNLRPRDIVVDGVLSYRGRQARHAPLLSAFREWLYAAAVDGFRPDVVHVHNLHAFQVGIGLLRRLRARGYPVAWTLHDMWAFTGGCVYAFDCDRFRGAGCDASCPVADEPPGLTRSRIRADFEARRAFYADLGRGVVIVTPSRWMADQARSGMLNGNRVEVIANGFDLDVYKPVPAAEARRVLGLPQDVPVVLAGAENLDDPRKGTRFLLDAMRLLAARRPVALATYGFGVPAGLSCPVVSLGRVGDDRLMRLCYGAADVFAMASLADNLPNVLVESLACGTPCVAFGVGGIPEIIQEGRTGFLARPGDAAHLADRIEYLLAQDDPARAAMREACRAQALARYDYREQGRTYLKLFESLRTAA